MPIHRSAILLVAGWLSLAALPAPAQPLIDHVPEDAVFYFGWAGTAAVEAGYAQSTFKHVVELVEPDKIRDAWRNALPMIRHAVDDPSFNEHYRHATAMLGASCEGAFAAYLTLKPIGADGGRRGDVVPPGLGLLWKPTTPESREKLLAGLTFYAQQSPLPNTLLSDGPVIGILINDPSAPVALGGAASDVMGPLARWHRFAGGWSKLKQTGPIAAYVDLPGIAGFVRQALATEIDDPQDLQTVNAVLDAVNLEGLGAGLITAGYDGRHWRTEAFLGAAAPRKGLALLFEAPTLGADALALAPKSASWCAVNSLDLGKLMDTVRAAVTAAGPEAIDPFEQGLAQVSGMVGVDVEEQLLRGFGTTWSLYLDPETAGIGYTGITLVNPLKDPDGVDRGLRAAQLFANLGATRALQDQWVKIQVHTQRIEDLDIHTLGTPLISPSWAVIDDKLVVGLYPHAVLAAKDRFAQPGSLLDNPDYAALRQEIGTRRLTGLSWVDLPRTVDQAYPGFVVGESLVTGLASMATGQPMPVLLPPLGRLRPHLEPAYSIGWIDDDGWHATSRSPFPGASALGPQGSGTAAYAPMLFGTMAPAISAARLQAQEFAPVEAHDNAPPPPYAP